MGKPVTLNIAAEDIRSTVPEEELMKAILVRAIRDYLGDVSPLPSKPKASARKLITSARGWFESTRRDTEYSFFYVCEILNLDRKAILKFLGECQEVIGDKNIMDMPFREYRNSMLAETAVNRTDYIITKLLALKNPKT